MRNAMSATTAIIINVVLDIGIVVAIVSHLGFASRGQAQLLTAEVRERRRGRERRRQPRPVPAHAERRRTERRTGYPVTA